MSNDAPVVFLAFANAPDEHLASLKTESRRVYRTLQHLEDNGQIHVHREESSELGELYEDLLRHDGRIVIFHYAGHADGATLRLEGGEGGGKGLASMLGQQSGLKLVFLNGCATKGHVRRLLDAGVPAVIATSVKIGDAKALEFSDAFYMALAEGRSISESFDSGSAFVEGRHAARGDAGVTFTRGGTDWEDEDEYDEPVLEWGLYVRDDAADDLEQWRLPSAQTDWEVRLSDADGPLRNLDGSPSVLKYHAPSRTVDTLVCASCGTSVTATPDHEGLCAICGSHDVQSASVTSQAADQYVPFEVSEEDAHACAAEFAGSGATVASLRQVYLPYWIIDAGIHSTFNAERGVVRDFAADSPNPEWEPVTDTVDLALDSHMVRAAVAPTGRDTGDRDWYWELDNAENLEPGNTETTSSVPLTETLQSAFEETSARLNTELNAEITDRVGGHQRRNISSDTRYRDLAARTVLMPHWYATVELEEGTSGLVINGQTAAVRSLQLPGTVNLTHRGEENMNKRTYESGAASMSTSLAASIFAGVGIGLMVGLLLGLANPPLGEGKPIVAIFIGAVGAALAALLGLNDRHFSTAKALRIGAFGLAVIVAAPTGIYVRDHQLLAPEITAPPSLADQKQEYLSLGYDEKTALEIMRTDINKASEASAASSTVLTAAMSRRGGLHSTETSTDSCVELNDSTPDLDSSDVRENFLNLFDDGNDTMNEEEKKWHPLITEVKSNLTGDDQKNLLFIARDASCGAGSFKGHKILPSDDQCKPGANLMARLDSADRQLVEARIKQDISTTEQDDATRFLEEFLCR